MDKPSALMAVIGAATATLVFGGATAPHADKALDAPVAAASTPSLSPSLDCRRGRAEPNVAPPVVPPTAPTDRQMNAAGTGAAGGAGTVPERASGDPCEPTRR